MPVDIVATVTCDMCGRGERVAIGVLPGSGNVDTSIYHILQQIPHWELLDRDGYPITDLHKQSKVLCESCAKRYKDTIAEKQKSIDALFERG